MIDFILTIQRQEKRSEKCPDFELRNFIYFKLFLQKRGLKLQSCRSGPSAHLSAQFFGLQDSSPLYFFQDLEATS